MNTKTHLFEIDKRFPCIHGSLVHQDKANNGLALIVIGNQLRGDDGIAYAVCNTLSKAILAKVCYFDLGLYTNFLADCFKSHRTVILLDATTSGAVLGSVHILNIKEVINGSRSFLFNSSHGISIMDEIRLQGLQNNLPEALIFFGIEVAGIDWQEQISQSLEKRLPHLKERLTLLIEKLLSDNSVLGAYNHA